MATITITDSENIAVEGGAQLPIIITIGATAEIGVYKRIDGFLVDQQGVPSATIAIGNVITGFLNGRYITAQVEALPYTNENNLDIFNNALDT
jgi:hypothetical protein